jgi:hypothetical protein
MMSKMLLFSSGEAEGWGLASGMGGALPLSNIIISRDAAIMEMLFILSTSGE